MEVISFSGSNGPNRADFHEMTPILIVQGQFWHMYGNDPPSKLSIHG